MSAPSVYIEIRQSSLKLLAGDAGLEVPLERLENNRLTPLSRERVTSNVREFLKKHGARPGLRAFCAIGARGVSLRRMTLPAASKEDLERLLVLQIEREFPLPPDELAWGYRVLGPEQSPGNGSGKTQQLLVVAVKKELLQEYADILTASGLNPSFTLAALARSRLVSQPPASYAVLDIGLSHSELVSFENGAPSSIRVIPWGDEKTPGEAELEALAKSLQANALGQKLYLTGAGVNLNGLAPRIAKATSIECELIEAASGEEQSAAILGLKKSFEKEGELPLILELKESNGTEIVARPTYWKWAALAALLLFTSASLRYAEAFIQKPRLSRRISDIKDYRDKLPKVDRELGFLQYLKTNQPPYLESLSAMASAAPPGSRIESLSMNRRGDFALRASMRDSAQVGDFRSKLISSGSFSTVVVDEQTPTPDKQKVLVRVTGQWKPSSDKKSPATEFPHPGTEKPKGVVKKPMTNATETPGSPVTSAINTNAPPKALKE